MCGRAYLMFSRVTFRFLQTNAQTRARTGYGAKEDGNAPGLRSVSRLGVLAYCTPRLICSAWPADDTCCLSCCICCMPVVSPFSTLLAIRSKDMPLLPLSTSSPSLLGSWADSTQTISVFVSGQTVINIAWRAVGGEAHGAYHTTHTRTHARTRTAHTAHTHTAHARHTHHIRGQPDGQTLLPLISYVLLTCDPLACVPYFSAHASLFFSLWFDSVAEEILADSAMACHLSASPPFRVSILLSANILSVTRLCFTARRNRRVALEQCVTLYI